MSQKTTATVAVRIEPALAEALHRLAELDDRSRESFLRQHFRQLVRLTSSSDAVGSMEEAR